jgi:hypothetical protein
METQGVPTQSVFVSRSLLALRYQSANNQRCVLLAGYTAPRRGTAKLRVGHNRST